VPGVGVTRFGSTRWLGFGPLVVQPSEIAKLATLLWVADVLERKRPKDGSLHEPSHLAIPAIPLLAILGVLVLAQPDLGTTILLDPDRRGAAVGRGAALPLRGRRRGRGRRRRRRAGGRSRPTASLA
jgi:hypothetical protein